jgi:hypothetical protein
LGVAVLLVAAAAAPADVITLGPTQSIASITGSGILAGDKLFSNFSVSSVGTNCPGAGDIYITPAQINGDYGVIFQSAWQADVGEYIDTLLTFKVTVLEGHAIDKIDMKLTGLSASNGGTISITENIWPDDPSIATDTIGDISVFFNSGATGTKRLFQETTLTAPDMELWVVKDIALAGRTGDAAMSQFYQSFHQVPEPATLGILCLGGLLMARRRQ